MTIEEESVAYEFVLFVPKPKIPSLGDEEATFIDQFAL